MTDGREVPARWCTEPQQFLGLLVAILCTQAPAASEDWRLEERPVLGIMDNSFFVEEAYNQEKGVVQHILNSYYAVNRQPGNDDEYWFLTFTQEWPIFSQKHQFSYTIPYNWSRTAGGSEAGLGDVLLNYRYQAYLDTNSLTAFAPRVSVILPTGDASILFGEDTWESKQAGGRNCEAWAVSEREPEQLEPEHSCARISPFSRLGQECPSSGKGIRLPKTNSVRKMLDNSGAE
jgi:hypothetical protein